MVFVCLDSILEFILEYALQSLLKSNLLGNILKKIMVSRNLCQAHLLKVGMTKIPRDHETLSIVRYVGHHVDFSSMRSSLSLQVVRSELRRSPPFRRMKALRLQWSRVFSLVCEVALSKETAPKVIGC